MKQGTLALTVGIGAFVLGASAWLTNAGPLNPPAGPVASTGVTTQELADLIAGSDPCMCEGLVQLSYNLSSSSTTMLSPGINRYIKRVTISKSVASAEVYLQLREPGSGVIGTYRLRPDEGSLVADVDLVLDGLQTQSLSVSSGFVQISLTYKNVP